jgi:hypothetical protein
MKFVIGFWGGRIVIEEDRGFSLFDGRKNK